MKSIFDRFNEELDVESLKADIEAVKGNDKEYEEIPVGTYTVTIEKMEQVLTKKAPERPMLSVVFGIIEGKYKNQKIFYNQLLTQPFPIHLSTKFLQSLESGVEVKFDNYTQYYDNILDVFEAIEGKKEYVLEYTKNKSGYDTYNIVGVFESEGITIEGNEVNIPFF